MDIRDNFEYEVYKRAFSSLGEEIESADENIENMKEGGYIDDNYLEYAEKLNIQMGRICTMIHNYKNNRNLQEEYK